MKRFLFVLAVLVLVPHMIVKAAPPGFPPEVNSAFEKAGLRLLNAKQPTLDFNLRLVGGGYVRLSDLKGKVVFLNFWATWCPPCRSEMPSMEVLYQRFKAQGLEFVAVDIGEEHDDVKKFMSQFNLSFPAALDESGDVSDNYGIGSIPATYIVGRDGNIIISTIGSRKWDTPEMIAAFDALLRSGQ